MIKPSMNLLDKIIKITWQASDAIMNIYEGAIGSSNKSDGSPLTTADLLSNDIITKNLQTLFPNTLIISEENNMPNSATWNNPAQFWLVDPLDGTKEFIRKNGEFTTNIALIEFGKPILGVVCAPALNTLYAGIVGYGAFKIDKTTQIKESITVSSEASKEGLYVVGSRSHNDPTAMDNYLSKQKIARFLSTGSSLKFCRVAEGSAHLYPRLGRTMEWDTAAGHAILVAAGGEVEHLDGTTLTYGKTGFENPHFIAKPGGLQLS